ncbi:MAG: hypothetical protein FD123_2250 [Bacteroidetes bacterium]|nr:MAG: hypothetical protein FD123_2250 [Bacteroidota bacterium]
MTEIRLTTVINAPIEKCFDLSRDVDVHMLSTKQTGERVVAGRTAGLCELHDEITWEARHFGIRQKLQVKITTMDRPHSFSDQMLKGAFKSMFHTHRFEEKNGTTFMHDDFRYEVPFWFIGWIFDRFVLKKYMTRFLEERNRVIKGLAEGKAN